MASITTRSGKGSELTHNELDANFTNLNTDKIESTEKGASNGVATLDATTQVPKAQLGTGTPDSTKYLRGDGTWAVPTGDGTGVGALPFYTSDGTQDDIALSTNQTMDAITINSQFRMDPAADFQVGTAFGWRDLFGPIVARGNNGPTLTNFRDGHYLYAFPSNASREIYLQYHIDHDYAIGTNVYPHLHFTVNSATDNGVVRLGFEYSVAKGHAQATGSTYSASTTVYTETTVTGATDQYKHFVAEVSDVDAIPSTLMEPDTIILLRVFTDIGSPNYTYTGEVFAIQADCHYQIGKFATPNKAPNFYGP